MNKKQFLLIVFLAFLPFVFNLIFSTLQGNDSFYFYLFSCSGKQLHEIPFLSKAFFELLPCNIVLFKAISFVVLILSSVIVAKTGELFDKKYGWLAGVFVFFSLAWVTFHVQVEDDLLGYPILFLANYFFLKGEISQRKALKALAVALVVFTGAFVWKGALLYLVAYSFFSALALTVLFASLFYIGFGAINGLLGNELVQENLNAVFFSKIGLSVIGLGHGFGLFGTYLFLRHFFVEKTKPLLLATPFLVALFLNAKWALHLSPFLGVGLMLLVKDLDLARIRKRVVFTELWAKENFKGLWQALSFFHYFAPFFDKHFPRVFVFFVVVSTFFLGVGLLLQTPSAGQIEAVKFAVSQANGGLIDNDWSYGYYIMFFGGDTNTFGGGWPRYTQSCNERILLTENPVPYNGCSVLKEWKKKGFYGNDIKVYECFSCVKQDDVGDEPI